MKRLYVLIGAPGSGKSTFIKKNKSLMGSNPRIISRDEIRFSMIDDTMAYFSKEKEVFKVFINQIIDGLKNAETVVVDATHLNEGSRSKLFRSISNFYFDFEVIGLCMEYPLSFCLENNNKREGLKRVPETALTNMWNSYSRPDLEVENYFDKLYIYKPNNRVVILERQ